MTDLSPAALAVLDAYYCDVPLVGSKRLATALRAAADRVVPKTALYLPQDATPYEEGIWDGKDDVHDQLLAIAAELEGQ